MEFESDISAALKVDANGFLTLSGRDYAHQVRSHNQAKSLALLASIINTLGELSAKAQKLKQIITTWNKFVGTDQRIYLKVAGTKALGFVKVGEKKLFYHDSIGAIKEIAPTSVLDIYVHQSCQRSGVGKEIFERFLLGENQTAEKLAYDRPSQKLLSFLKKHYGLSAFIPQNNNYVIYDRFFTKIGDAYEKQKLSVAERIFAPFYNKYSKPETTLRESQNNKTLPVVLGKNLEKREQKEVSKKYLPVQDSLTQLTQQIEALGISQKNIYHNIKEAKDQSRSSFGCPWAREEKMGFRTTSNAYGNHYNR